MASTWTMCHKPGLDKMAKRLTRPPTPSMPHNSLRSTSKVGSLPDPRIRIPNMRSPISAFSWLSFVNAWEMTMQRYQHHLDLNVHYWETPPLQLHQLSIQLASSRFQPPRMPGWLTTCPLVSLIDLSPSG